MSQSTRTLLVKYRRLWLDLYSDWSDLVIVTFGAIDGSSVRRSQAKLRWAIWLCKIDFVGVHGLINDLLW